MIYDLETFLKEANTLLAALTEYNEVTDRLCNVDLKQEDTSFVIDDVAGFTEEREEIRERAEAARIAMTAAIDKMEAQGEQGEREADLIKCTFKGEEVAYSLSGDARLAKDVIYKLLAIQKDIIEKDGVILGRLAVKRDEIKSQLKNLQGDRKKLDFLNVNVNPEANLPEDIGFL